MFSPAKDLLARGSKRQPAKRIALAACAALPLVAAGTLHADRFDQREQTIQLAHPEVRGLLRNGDYRVVTGVHPGGTSWIAVEKLEAGMPAWQAWVHNARWGARTLSIAHDLGEIRLDSSRGGIVAFTALHQNRDWLRCTIETREWPWTTVCSGTYTGPVPQPPQPPPPPPQPQPRPPSWSADPAVISACDLAFSSPASEQRCLEAMGRYRYHPRNVIAACDLATNSDEQALACVRHAGAASADPSEIVRACDLATNSDAAVTACMTAAIGLADPPATIRACDLATNSDDDLVACTRRASGMR